MTTRIHAQNKNITQLMIHWNICDNAHDCIEKKVYLLGITTSPLYIICLIYKWF